MKTKIRTRYLMSALLLFSVVMVSVVSAEGDKADGAEASLYERLGGVYSIATVVDELIERLEVNDVLNANPAIDKARTAVPKAGIKFRLTAMICQATGGPEVYHGRSMKDSHARLNISNAEWDEMERVFGQLLNDFKVPEKEQRELFALIGPTKADIVTAD
ncbi:MAG: group 1 truncated hemoglobin [bacterium]|nr:group 1 truncated hemoglobin [bacterium]